MDFVKNRILLLTTIGLLFCNIISAQTTKSMWVGESYQCDPTSALLGLVSDISWTTNGGYFSLKGSGGYRTVTVTQYFLGTASVTCSWKYRLYSNDQWKTQSKTWYFTCLENPISITPTTMTLAVGENSHVSYAHLYNNSYVSFSDAYFESNNDAVATVSSSGIVTAVSPGTAYIVVYSKISEPSSCKVIVTNNDYSGPDDTVPPTVETEYEIVDLGLSVNWASHNLGATSPEGDGDYYAWGETVTKKTFYSSNCSTLGLNAFDIYSKDKNGDWVLPSNYDAAYCSWGEQWRIPTHREFNELIEKCEWVWVTKNGRNGYEITGPNGKKIFLPASGFYDGNINSYKNTLGNYLHSTIYSSHNCQGLGFRNNNIWIWSGDRHLGRTIRPVTEAKPKVSVTSVSLNITNLELSQGDSAALRATLSPEDATEQSVTWSSSNTAVAIVDGNGMVTAVAPGVAIITATANDSSGVSASCEVTISLASYIVTYLIDEEVFMTDTLSSGAAITLPEEPAKEGYTFSGWSEIPDSMPPHDVTVYGSFIPNTYEVTYVIGEEIIWKDSVVYGTTITVPNPPAKEGYTFNGWEAPKTMPAEDVVLTGTYTINSYRLEYIVDGELYHSTIVNYNDTVVPISSTPSKEGYIFAGWANLPTVMPAYDVKATAMFEVNKYRITYIVDNQVVAIDSIVYGTDIVLMDPPAVEGYTFVGWSYVPEKMPAADVMVIGIYIINSYQLTYMVDGVVYDTKTIVYDENVPVLDEPTKEGHTFSGWSEAPETMPANDIIISGVFTINKYLVTFKIDDEVIAADSLEYGATIVAPDAPEREGYTFDGWGEVPETVPANDVTIEGSYTANIYKVYYYVGEELVHTAEVTYGEAIPEYIYEPTEEGYTFLGWLGEAYETMPAHDVTYTANIESGINQLLIDNGQLTIYDLAGRKVLNMENLKGGIYIVNGKKVVVK